MFDFIPKRYVLSLVGFSATTLSVALQTNVSIAIVYMVQQTSDASSGKPLNECGTARNRTNIVHSDSGVYVSQMDWSPDIQGIAISAQFLAMIMGFIPGGRLAEVFGAKRTMILTLFTASLATAMSPIAAEMSIYAFIVCRIIVGFGSAPVFPILMLLINRWIPESEQSAASSFMLAGYGTGTFLSYLVAGALCASDVFGGWPSVFYISGLWGFIWCIWCYFVVYDHPEIHPNITSLEKNLIVTKIGFTPKKISSVPWKSIITSVPVWALAIGCFGQYWLLAFTITSQTVYMGTVLNLESAQNGLLSCIPSLLRAVLPCITGCLIDCVRRRKDIPIVYVRKGATLANTLVSCLGFVGILFSGCDPILNTIFFIVATMFGDFCTFGVSMVPNDMAPNIGGTLSGILSCIGSFPYVLLPLLVGFITKEEQSMAQWKYVYFCTIGVTLVTTFIFLAFGSSDLQPWATDKEEGLPTADDIEKNAKPRTGSTLSKT